MRFFALPTVLLATVLSSTLAFQARVGVPLTRTTTRPLSPSAFSVTNINTKTHHTTTAKISSIHLSLRNPFPDTPIPNSNKKHIQKYGRRILQSTILAFLSLSMLQSPVAHAAPVAAAATATAAKVTTEHLHTGQKIANWFMNFGLPKWAVLATISAMPVVELRGAVPVGIWLGLPITTVLPICVMGNMAPIIPLLFLLRNQTLKKLMAPILNRAEKKAAGLGVGSPEKQWISLATFVGIPLPGTGAWTGAMGAFLLGMPTALAISSIFAGVVIAGLIMSAITLAGKKGGIAAIAILLAIAGKELIGSKGSGSSSSSTKDNNNDNANTTDSL